MAFERDPKAMAKSLRKALAAQGIEQTHSQCLELVAQQLGYKDWNTAAALHEMQTASVASDLKLPFGWQVSGTHARDYAVGIDKTDPEKAATIRSVEKDGPYVGFATLMQSINAHAYHGSKLRLSAELRTKEVFDAATIWMRLDDAQSKSVGFDNMEQRVSDGVLRDTSGWTRRSIVLEVPEEAESIHYGFYLRGAGQCWARAFDLQIVAADEPVTGSEKARLDRPTNMDFAATSAR